MPAPRQPSWLTARLRRVRARLRGLSYFFRSPHTPDESRFGYQPQHIHYQFKPGANVLDIGSGNDPFVHATVIADRFVEPTHHRSTRFQTAGKPLVICDIQALPFARSSFDYVICSHVLEHVDNPILACSELQRVAAAGFVETPTLMKDALFSWARGMHKWHVIAVARRLVFFEYGPRQLDGIASQAWWDLIFGPVYHPMQDAFNNNQDLFNVMLEWNSDFEVMVMRLDGSIESVGDQSSARHLH